MEDEQAAPVMDAVPVPEMPVPPESATGSGSMGELSDGETFRPLNGPDCDDRGGADLRGAVRRDGRQTTLCHWRRS